MKNKKIPIGKTASIQDIDFLKKLVPPVEYKLIPFIVLVSFFN